MACLPWIELSHHSIQNLPWCILNYQMARLSSRQPFSQTSWQIADSLQGPANVLEEIEIKQALALSSFVIANITGRLAYNANIRLGAVFPGTWDVLTALKM